MTRPDFDVIVAGAGVAGATAALHLGQAGLRVLVVDKACLPRYKPCGGAIARPTLDRLLALAGRPAPPGLVRAAPARARFTHPGLETVDFPLPGGPMVMVMRSEFDAFLLSCSTAEVLDRTTVTGVEESEDGVRVRTGDRSFTAAYLVGADGATSQIARWLGLRAARRLGGTLEAEVPVAGVGPIGKEYADQALFAVGTVPWGYAWVFPKGDLLSVGIGCFRPRHVDLHSALRQVTAGLGISLDGVQLHGHPIPSYRTPPWPWIGRRVQETLSTRRSLLVGDAAGLVDPLVGEGIRYAAASARLAAEAIVQGDFSHYEEGIWHEIGHDLATAGLTAALCYRFPRACYRLGVRNPVAVHHFLDILTEQRPFQGIGRRLIATTILWLLRGNRQTPRHQERIDSSRRKL